MSHIATFCDVVSQFATFCAAGVCNWNDCLRLLGIHCLAKLLFHCLQREKPMQWDNCSQGDRPQHACFLTGYKTRSCCYSIGDVRCWSYCCTRAALGSGIHCTCFFPPFGKQTQLSSLFVPQFLILYSLVVIFDLLMLIFGIVDLANYRNETINSLVHWFSIVSIEEPFLVLIVDVSCTTHWYLI